MPSLSESKSAGPGMSGKQYWRSLDALADSPEVRRHLEREFPNLFDVSIPNATRRNFLKLMGASLALGGLAGCRWPKENIVEWSKRPMGRLPGKPVFYATTMDLNGTGIGLLVKSFDGRPIKVEGNPDHPGSLGGTDALAQAAILEMYDQDRVPTEAQVARREAFLPFARKHFAELAAKKGAGLAILAGPSSSPTLGDQRAALTKALPEAKWYEYDPLSRDNCRAGTQLAFNKPMRPQIGLSKADVIVSFDEDFLMTHPAAVRLMREFARRRTTDNKNEKGEPLPMNRLYVLEANYSLTGTNADHRYAERVVDLPIRLAQLAGELVTQGLQLTPGAASAAEKLKGFNAGPHQPAYMAGLARDLIAHKGASVILCGPRLAPEAHALACALNEALGALGATVGYSDVVDVERKTTHVDAIAALSADMVGGRVQTLVILGGNPVFDAPADVDFGAALAKVPTSIHLSLHSDETSQRCTWHVPAAHWLESWGDARAWDGTYSIVQPLIAPLYDGLTAIEMVGLVTDPTKTPSGYDAVRATFKDKFAGKGDFEAAWRKALHDGIVPNTAWHREATPLTRNEWGVVLDALNQPVANRGDAYEVVFTQDYKVFDGRFANNAWLQELPDPLTKLTWDNAALISPADAKTLGVSGSDVGDKIAISLGGKKIEIAAFVVPGHAKGSITLPLGYGRTAPGLKIAEGSGVNVTALRTKGGFQVASGATAARTGMSHHLSTTQDHHTIESSIGDKEQVERPKNELVRWIPVRSYENRPKQLKHEGHSLQQAQLFNGADYTRAGVHRWAMAIDLSKCTGCSACVIACQSENNIPVVGREEVDRGREMHWLRIDRYFRSEPGEVDDPQVAYQPMPCQQCENAPCEQVCPVAATTHDTDGLNVMVYNRCVGTRYCSNNCPYKVRRFNWFYNHHGPRHPRSNGVMAQTNIQPIEMMAHNPDVTVRSRGVMEKCTFCVQRIEAAKISHRNEEVTPALNSPGTEIKDGEIIPACAQACPAEAIIFGDKNNKESAVARAHEHDRAYGILEDVNTRPRNQYLARLINPAEPATGSHNPGQLKVQAPAASERQVV